MARYPVKGRDLFRFKSVFAGKFRATVVHPAQIFDVKMDFQRVNFIQRHIMSRVQRSRPVGQPRMMLPAARARSRTASFRRSCTVRLTRSETSSSVRCEGRTSSFPSMTSIQSRSSCSGGSTGSSKSSAGDTDQSFSPNGPGRLTCQNFPIPGSPPPLAPVLSPTHHHQSAPRAVATPTAKGGPPACASTGASQSPRSQARRPRSFRVSKRRPENLPDCHETSLPITHCLIRRSERRCSRPKATPLATKVRGRARLGGQ